LIGGKLSYSLFHWFLIPDFLIPDRKMDNRMAENEETTLDPERQREAKEYARIRRRLLLVDLALGGVFVLAWLFSGASLWLRNQVVGWVGQYPLWVSSLLTVALYAAVFGVIYGLLDAPLSYYSGFVLPHRYGLSVQTFRAWLWDQVKGAAIGGILGLVLLEVMYALVVAVDSAGDTLPDRDPLQSIAGPDLPPLL
jgi:hypothetical protein